jgi:hypothetical protein
MKARTLVYASAFGLLWSFTATAQPLPRFNTEATCRTAQALTPQDRDPVQGCMRDEAEAERQLQAVWTSAVTAHREACAAETQVEGFPSYVDVLTCLQMYQGAASSVPPPRRRKQP